MLGRCHLITDPGPGRDPLAVLPAALAGGIDVVQVRVKEAGDRRVLALVVAALELCRAAGAACIVNDRLDVALAAGADGVHLGDADLPVAAARAVAGPGLVIGATVRDADAARRAVADGATYVGAGPAYPTTTKSGLPAPIGSDGIAAVAAAVHVPVIAIAGITADRAAELVAAGAHGVAIASAINDAPDPEAAARAIAGAVRAAVDQ